MPKHSQTFSTNSNAQKAMAIAYEVFNSPGFQIKYAGDSGIIGHSSTQFKKQGEQIDFTIQGNLCEVRCN